MTYILGINDIHTAREFISHVSFKIQLVIASRNISWTAVQTGSHCVLPCAEEPLDPQRDGTPLTTWQYL